MRKRYCQVSPSCFDFILSFLICSFRIQAQFDHLAEAYFFCGFDTDLAERELGYVTAFDHDLDMFAASISLARTSVAGLVKEDGMLFFPIPNFGLHSSCRFPTSLVDVVLEMGGYNIDQEFFEPLNGVLNRCKSAKNLSRSAFDAFQSRCDF